MSHHPDQINSVVFPWVTLSHFSGLLDMFKLICVSTKIILIKSFVNFHNSKSGVSSAYADKVHAVLCNTHTHTHTHTHDHKQMAHSLPLSHLLTLPSYAESN